MIFRARPGRVLKDGRHGVFSFLVGKWTGLLLIMIVLLPFILIRNRMENSIWVDEVYSILLSGKPVDRLISLTTMDDHPPGFYIALKAWNHLGEVLKLAPSLLWARSLNVVFWVLLTTAAWFFSRALLGSGMGAILAWAVAAGSQVLHAARDIRGYGFAIPAMFICFLALVYLWKKDHYGKSSLSYEKVPGFSMQSALLWGFYVLSGTIGLYSHLLTSLLLFVLGIIWLCMAYQKPRFKGSFFLGGFASHLLIILLFLPWIFRLRHQLAYHEAAEREWMTPATLWNLLRVFIYWQPFGRLFDLKASLAVPVYLSGGLSFLLPWAGLLRRPETTKRNNLLLPLAMISMVISFGFVLCLFLLNRYMGFQVFHGPRYPALVAPIWVTGLVMAAGWSAKRWKRGTGLALFLMIPWFACSVTGLVWVHRRESRGGIGWWKEIASSYFPGTGEDLYVLPPELIPYFHQSLSEFNTKSIDEIAHVPKEKKDILIIDLNYWPQLRTPRDLTILKMIKDKKISRDVEIFVKPELLEGFVNYRLREFRHQLAGELFKDGVRAVRREFPNSACARALPEWQLLSNGWSVVEFDDQYMTFRWGLGRKSSLAFDGYIHPGKYEFHLIGYRTRYPENPLTMKFQFRGEDEIHEITLGDGGFHISLPMEFSHSHSAPVLLIQHPSWRPCDYLDDSTDPRSLSFLFGYAWLEPL